MASTRIIEQDHGTYAGLVTHHHNGYYAGDFSRPGTVHAAANKAPRDDWLATEQPWLGREIGRGRT